MGVLQRAQHAWRIRAAEASGLFVALAVAAWLRFHAIPDIGLGNLFYASAVRSMSLNWHNFWFAAYDPAGTLIVDKPPLALWVQVLAVRLLNFDAWGLVGPMALAGTVAVGLTWGAARRSFGAVGAAVAALALAVFPESVATSRDSTMDAMLCAMLAGAAWLLISAVEGRRFRLLFAWAVLMGLVFNVKFFEGFLVLPASALYLAVRWRKDALDRWRLLSGVAGTLVLVSVSWVVMVEAIPAEHRPRVMNDRSNSAVGLVLRYNGLERVLPAEVTIFAPIPGASAATNASLEESARAFGVGDAGPARLFTGSNGPLMGATVLLALAGVVLTARDRARFMQGPALFWSAWAVTGILLFSASNRAAAQYTESYAPALAALVGLGSVEVARWRGWRGTGATLGTVAIVAGYSLWAVRGHPPLSHPTTVAVSLLGLAAVLMIAATRSRYAHGYRTLAFLAVLGIPAAASIWITTEAPHGGQITRPNPLVYATRRPPAPGSRAVPTAAILAAFPEDGRRYRFGIDGVNNAGEAVAFEGVAVLPVWNEYQRAGTLPAEELDGLLKRGEVPGFVLGLGRLRSGLIGRDVMDAVQRHCRLDPRARVGAEWSVWRCDP